MDIVLEELSRNMPASTTKDLVYYVSTTGNNNNDGLTAEKPFFSVAKALSRLPKIIDHDITIYAANGKYVEDINISGFSGTGSISIIGNINNPRNVIFYSIVVSDCFCAVNILGMKFLK